MRVIYVDDEMPAIDNFRLTVAQCSDIEDLQVFQNAEDALEWSKIHKVDVAFLDMEMSGMHGLELAKHLKKISEEICIIFVTAYEQYALLAFGVDALGYILKPYTRQEVQKELDKARRWHPLEERQVKIETIPSFVVSVDNKVVHLGRAKAEELLALLVDRAGGGLTAGEAIACLWPGRTNDENTQSLYRVTFKRLMDALKEAGIAEIIATQGREKYIRKDKVDCDLYKILEGDREVQKSYAGEYLREYSWAENRNAQLSRMLLLSKD